MQKWLSFEERVIRDAEINDVILYKMPERFKGVYSKSKTKQLKTPFDCFGAIDGKAIFFDCKSTAKDNFLFSTVCFAKKKIHQWQALKRSSEMGSIAGYLVHFYEIGVISWVPVEMIVKSYLKGLKSIKPNEVPSQPDNQMIELRKLIKTVEI